MNLDQIFKHKGCLINDSKL